VLCLATCDESTVAAVVGCVVCRMAHGHSERPASSAAGHENPCTPTENGGAEEQEGERAARPAGVDRDVPPLQFEGWTTTSPLEVEYARQAAAKKYAWGERAVSGKLERWLKRAEACDSRPGTSAHGAAEGTDPQDRGEGSGDEVMPIAKLSLSFALSEGEDALMRAIEEAELELKERQRLQEEQERAERERDERERDELLRKARTREEQASAENARKGPQHQERKAETANSTSCAPRATAACPPGRDPSVPTGAGAREAPASAEAVAPEATGNREEPGAGGMRQAGAAAPPSQECGPSSHASRASPPSAATAPPSAAAAAVPATALDAQSNDESGVAGLGGLGNEAQGGGAGGAGAGAGGSSEQRQGLAGAQQLAPARADHSTKPLSKAQRWAARRYVCIYM